MVENCFYIIKDEFFNKFEEKGSIFKYNKNASRPTYCCFEDKLYKGLYWAVPTGTLKTKNIDRIECFMSCTSDIRGSYYHIGYTNQKAIFYISSAFPITDKYIERAYTVQNKPLELKRQAMIKEIKGKLLKILSYENHNPNHLETHITDIRTVLIEELADNK